MLAPERRRLLIDWLTASGSIVAKDAAAQLGTSEDTIRRDLRELAADGLCRRVYGGAVLVAAATADYTARASVEPDAKAAVAAEAATLVRPGSTVILDGGTTTLAVVGALPRDLSCTVVTHSPTIAAALEHHRDIEVLLIGGRLFKHSMVACGAAAVEAAARVSADVFLLGVTGVDADQGLTTGDADEAAMKRALARRAAETVVLASREKVGAVSPFAVLGLDDVARIVTDAPAGHPTLEAIRTGHPAVEIAIAHPPRGR